MRIAYFGTPDDAVAPLRAVVAAGHDVALVVTQPDRRRGRGGGTAPSPVRATADALGLPVRTPTRAGDLADELADLGLDAGVVVAFGQLLPASVLATARHGYVNLHFSLLPRWRGAAPVERAVLAGDDETGVCVMALDEGMDTGPVYDRVVTAIGPREDAGTLRRRLVDLGTPLLVGVLADLAHRVPEPQRGDPVAAPKLSVDEFRLRFTEPVAVLDRLVRAGTPRPGAWAECDGRRLKVVRAEPCGEGPDGPVGTVGPDACVRVVDGGLRLLEVRPEGRSAMSATAWLAGRRGAPTVLA